MWFKVLAGGLFGVFSDLHLKKSVLWVCSIANLNQISENVCSPDVSASSVLVYSLCGYCPSGTSEYVLELILQVFYCIDIDKCLPSCIQAFCTFKYFVWFSIKLSDIGKGLRLSAGCFPDQNRSSLSSIYMCSLSIGFCRQFGCGVNVYRFPSWTDGKRCNSLLSPKSFLFLFYLLLYLLN